MADENTNPAVTEEEETDPTEPGEDSEDEPMEEDPVNPDATYTEYTDPYVEPPSVTLKLSDGLAFNQNYALTLFMAEDGYLKRTESGLYVGNLNEVVEGYILLTSEPTDWADNFTSYYESDGGGGYQNLTGDTAPAFEQNKYYKKNESKENIKSTTELAQEVIEGKWGNGAERKRRLTEAGYDYDAVQAEVNRLLRVGNSSGTTSSTPTTNDGLVCGIVERGEPNRTGALFTVKLAKGTQFYKINGSTVTPNGTIKDYDTKYFYNIRSKTTIDGHVYLEGWSGWWIYDSESEPVIDPIKTNVALEGFDEWTVIPYSTPDTCMTNPSVVQHIYTLASQRVIARDSNSVSVHTTVVKDKSDVIVEMNWLNHNYIYSGEEYILLIEEPISWETRWTEYYIYDESTGMYIQLSGESYPQFEPGVYYKKNDSSSLSHQILKGDLVQFVTYKSERPPAYDLNDERFVGILSNYSESCERMDRIPSDDMTCNALFIVESVEYDDETYTMITSLKLRCIWTDGTIGKVGRTLQNNS